ncbi:ABC transporter permease [Kiloniella laminariae]|uniref:ABC transporter permease n=1 Tax=Kiloniella laminariae TaxID=454162 RepID=A0ABT4LHJ0_9PROT|nr:ABC transporter permease [Kiloniella laminariae]MCZ4280570.1 ABC transporter permease [Kiloniella laminariae]
MNDFSQAFSLSLDLIFSLDARLAEIVLLSLRVSLSAVLIATLIGLPLGAALATLRFPGRRTVNAFLSSLMGLPPVVVGLVVYLLLSRSGPMGSLGLLFTPTAMIIAQSLLITPIIASLARQVSEDLWGEYRDQLTSLGCEPLRAVPTILWDGRYRLTTAVLAGFGRATAEVGAVMIVGGNIDHVTRVMTTTIALETSKGNLSLALALGMILITLSLTINVATFMIRDQVKGESL